MRNATLSRFRYRRRTRGAAGRAAVPSPLGICKFRKPGSLHRLPTETLQPRLRIRSDLALTVYNSNLSLVRDVRQLTLPSGESRLRFMDIAASINPATVHFRSLTEPAKLNVLEQNYEYDLLDPNKLLQKYVGREVTWCAKLAADDEYEEVKATLLS